MNTIHPRKKSFIGAVGAAVAAAALPAFLFTGAGSAQAETDVVPFSDALGVSVHVVSKGPVPSGGWCTYTATPAIVPPGVVALPVYNVPFYLQDHAIHKLWFPGIQTGTVWNVDVNCAHGGDAGVIQKVY